MRVADPAGGLEVVGREDELAVIERRPRSLVIEGEAGIGKTTLWAHGVAVAQQELAWVLSTRPTEAETAFAYAGLTDLLDPVLTEVLPQLPQPQRQALEVALLRAEGSADPHAVSVAVLSVLRILAAVAPVQRNPVHRASRQLDLLAGVAREADARHQRMLKP